MKEERDMNRISAIAAALLCAATVVGVFYVSQAAGQVVDDQQGERISVVAGQSHVVKAPWPTVRVAVTDPKVADVQILTPDQVLLQGLKVGSTDLILWNEDETKIWKAHVNVTLDAAKLYELFPNCALELDQSGDVLLVKGLLRSTDQAAQLHNYLDKTKTQYVDMTSVAGVQQVQLQVRIAEVSRNVVKELTTNFIYADSPFFGAVAPTASDGTPLVSATFTKPVTYNNTSWDATQAVSVLVGVPRANFDLFIHALAENQYLRILANPTLVALSGEEASFLAGGEYPIPVVQGITNNSITIEYKEYGVRLTFRPTVLGDGTIKLYAAPEVSELTSVGSVVISGFEVPAITTRKAETTLELKSGQTFAMAGLLRNNVSAVASKLPGIGDLPVLGPLFRSVRFSKAETELVVLVTANLVEPMNMAKTPPLPGFLYQEPNDWEFYLGGKIEGQKPASINPADAEWLRQMGLENLVGPGAWDYYSPIAASSADVNPEIMNEEQGSGEPREDTGGVSSE
jgi:pilus assembly protein CpaC